VRRIDGGAIDVCTAQPIYETDDIDRLTRRKRRNCAPIYCRIRTSIPAHFNDKGNIVGSDITKVAHGKAERNIRVTTDIEQACGHWGTYADGEIRVEGRRVLGIVIALNCLTIGAA